MKSRSFFTMWGPVPALVLFSCLASAPISFAQSTTYLSNLAETGDGLIAAGSDQFLAQSFVTGTDVRGYSLDFVKLSAGTDCGTPPGNFQVYLYSDNAGQPGNNLGQLFGPNPSGFGTYTYSTNGIGLSPTTTYWIVVNSDQSKGDCSGTGFYGWDTPASNNFTATDNWSINTDAQGSGDGGASWGSLPYRFKLEINAHVKLHRRVALVAADEPGWAADVKAKLDYTGRFSQVDIIDAELTTPSVAQLLAYHSVLVWHNRGFADATALGNNLADYIDQGGGVVIAVFTLASPYLGGRFASDNYFALVPSGLTTGNATLGTVFESNSPLMAGVISFDGGISSHRGTGSAHPDADVVADWSDGNHLIVRRNINGTRRADVNFFPPSTDSRFDFWVPSTDGAKMIANALDFVGGTANCVPPPSGMTAWWRADGNADDSAGGHHGTLLGGATFASGEVSQGFSFNGDGAYVSVPGPVANFGTGDFTIDFWMQTTTNDTREIINKRVCGDAPDAFEVRTAADGAILVELLRNNDNTGSFLYSTGSYNDGQFHHITIVRSGDTLSIYGDGKPDNSITNPNVSATNIDNDLPLGIGGGGCGAPEPQGDSTQTFEGILDEIEIFNRALSASEISKIYRAGSNGKCGCTPTPPNMVSWWPAEGNATDVQDGNHGTFLGTPAFTSGTVGQAFDFDGASYVSIPDAANLSITGDITIDAWVRPTANNSFMHVVSKRDNDNSNVTYEFFRNDNGTMGFASRLSNTNTFANSTSTVPLDTWSHVAVVISGTNITFYLNGVAEAPQSYPFARPATTDVLTIGDAHGNFGDAEFWSGQLDEIELFNTALSDEDIAKIYHAGSAGKCRSCVSAPASMTDWWPGDGNADNIQGFHEGTLENGASFGAGKVGPAFSLDGDDDYVDVGDVDLGATFTIDAWINPDSLFADHAIFAKADCFCIGPGISYVLGVSGNGSLFALVINDSGGLTFYGTNAGVIASGIWQHVALIYDGNAGAGAKLTFYVNGNPVSGSVFKGDDGGIPLNNTTPTTIGNLPANTNLETFDGLIDEVEVFDRILSAEEIAAIFNAGSGGKCKPEVAAVRQFANISSRADVGTGNRVAIGGFIIHEDSFATATRATHGVAASKIVLVRGIGPSLNITGDLDDPFLELRDSAGDLIESNDNWGDAANASNIQDTGLAPSDSLESAILVSLPTDANYTAILKGAGATTGIGLIEVYDLEMLGSAHLANISTRAFVSTGPGVLIGGIIVQGGTPTRVVLRGVGPSLETQGIPVGQALQDPFLELHDGNGALLETNDDWASSPEAAAITASGLAPTHNKESAILFVPAPGNYTAILSGVSSGTGIGLVEGYNIGP